MRPELALIWSFRATLCTDYLKKSGPGWLWGGGVDAKVIFHQTNVNLL